MLRIHGVRKALFAGFITVGLTSIAFAQTSTPATGLGQAWPNAADQSASPNWRVYVFYLNGIKYVQVNDLNGTVHAAVGAASGTVVVLPVGVDAQRVQSATSTASSAATTVYSDGATIITATPQSTGGTTFNVQQAQQAQMTKCTPLNCSAVASGVQ